MDMQPNILPTAPMAHPPQTKSQHSALSILFMILLTGVLIILSEKILFDVNKAFNPSTYSKCANTYSSQGIDGTCYTQDRYDASRLLIHALITLPILLGAVLLYLLYERKTASGGHVASWAYFGAAFWLCIRLLGEMMYFLIRKYESLGIYIVLAIFAAILTWLVVVLQRRHAARLAQHNQ